MPTHYDIKIVSDKGDKSLILKEGEKFLIGRKVKKDASDTGYHILLESKVVSRHHAEIKVEGGKLLLKDTKSSSGTFVNGVRLSEPGEESEFMQINYNDHLLFGEDCEVDGVVHFGIRMEVGEDPNPQSMASLRKSEARPSHISESPSVASFDVGEEWDTKIQGDIEEEFESIWQDLNIGLDSRIEEYLLAARPKIEAMKNLGLFGIEPPERTRAFEKRLSAANLLKIEKVR